MTDVTWNPKSSLIPNREGLRVRVLIDETSSIRETSAVIACDTDGRHFISKDGTLDGHIWIHRIVCWRMENP